MARAVAEIEKEIRALEPDDQEHLLRALLEELDGPADPDVERAWLAEAQQRGQELDSGVVETTDPEPYRRLRRPPSLGGSGPLSSFSLRLALCPWTGHNASGAAESCQPSSVRRAGPRANDFDKMTGSTQSILSFLGALNGRKSMPSAPSRSRR
jgi:Putative addiction module component